MILVALGTQRFQMNRLVEAMDQMAAQCDEEIYIQTGNSTYIPKKCAYSSFVDANDFQRMIDDCSVLVTHAGVGTIMRGINANKPVVVIPRLAKYQEHVDDHQKQIAEAFSSKGCVLVCEELSELTKVLEETKTFSFQPYKAPESKIDDIILQYIEKLN